MDRIIDGLTNAPAGRDDYEEYLQDLFADETCIERPEEFFQHAFRFFEEHSAAHLGMPGPLVHFLEQFYPQYVEELVASVNRRPTSYTLWMLNRILNADITGDLRERLTSVLRMAAELVDNDVSVRQEARHFLGLQERGYCTDK
jgi:hypothetical protein